MNEKEMIEEMAEVIFNSRYKNGYISPLKGANELYNAGYRKVPEGSVVLTEKEYNKLIERPLKAMGELTCEQIKCKKKFGVEV